MAKERREIYEGYTRWHSITLSRILIELRRGLERTRVDDLHVIRLLDCAVCTQKTTLSRREIKHLISSFFFFPSSRTKSHRGVEGRKHIHKYLDN